MLQRYRQFLFGVLASLCITALLLIIARRPAGHPVLLPAAPTPRPLRIHVTGEVATPGVYALPAGSIAQDALTAAGGANPQADLSRMNLALPLADGDQLNLPSLPATQPGAPLSAGPTPAAPALTPAANPKINLNTATATELDTLPGIGPVIAQRIVDYRTQHGPFARPEDLLEVQGIGETTFNLIQEAVYAGP